MVEPFQNEFGDFFDDADMRGPKELANLLQLVHGRDLVLVRRGAVDHPRPPVRFDGSPARIHDAPTAFLPRATETNPSVYGLLGF